MVFIWYGGFQPHAVSERIPYERIVDQITPAKKVAAVDHSQAQHAIQHYLEQVGDQKQAKQRRPVMTVGELMTKEVLTIAPETRLREAWHLMNKHKIRHLPVWTETKGLVGLFSDRNLAKALAADIEGHPLSQLGDQFVQSWMTKRVLTAHRDTPIREAASLLVRSRINSLPIVDDENRLIGILTSTDILAAVVNKAPLDLWI